MKFKHIPRKVAEPQRLRKELFLFFLCVLAPLRGIFHQSCLCLLLVFYASTSALAQPASSPDPSGHPATILIFGNSLTAGYGLDPSQAFPALLQQKIDSLGWGFKVIGAGLSGETTAGGLRRIDWMLQRKIDIFILELGGNDGLRGLSLQDTEKNLQGMIDKARKTYPEIKIILAGMQVPPNLGPEYTARFQKVYSELARKNDIPLIRFLLEGVGGIPELNQPDRIHPNVEGHKILAENVWKVLEKTLLEFRMK